MKIAYLISPQNESVQAGRRQFYEQRLQLMTKSAQDLNVLVEFEIQEIAIDQLQYFLKEQKEKYSAFRLAPEFQEVVTAIFPNLPTVERIVQVADFIFFEKKLWWPRLLLADSLSNSIIRKVPNLDSQAQGLIVGDGAEAQVALYVLIKLGFSRINLVTDHSNKIQSIIDRTQQSLFGIHLKLISPDELTLLPNICSIAINTLTVISEEDLLMNDLKYLNFLKPTGLLVDLSETDSNNPLITEAKNIETQTLHSSEIEQEIQKIFFQKLISEI